MELQDRFILTVDSDPKVSSTITDTLGIQTKWFASSDELTEEVVNNGSPVAAFLEVALSLGNENNGQLISRLKDSWPLCPVILTTTDRDHSALTEGMALGADDFISKPLSPGELKSRMEVRVGALARRAARETIEVGDLVIDTLQRSVSSEKGHKFLSPTEIRLITELAKAGGGVVPRDMLKKRCWPQTQVSDNALNRKLYEVRKRLQPLSKKVNIRTIYGVGFVLENKGR